MAKLFDRDFQLTIQDKKLTGLDAEFQIERSLDPTQNTAEVVVYNLSAETRKHLQSIKGGVVVKLSAGYKGENPLTPGAGAALSEIGIDAGEVPPLFLGVLREVTHMREGADWVTRVSSGDGDSSKKASVSFSMGPGTTYQTVVNKVIGEMKVGVGNAAQLILQGKFKEVGKVFDQGVTVHGNAGDELRKLLVSAELEHSIQNGELQILPQGKPLNVLAVNLTASTGLIGSPEIGSKGIVKCVSLLNSQIYPGRKIKIESDSVSGFFRVEKATYIGQTVGNDWYTAVEGKAL